MKLYTESEVKELVRIAFWQDFNEGETEEDIINKAKSIELLSDEEIANKSEDQVAKLEPFGLYPDGFVAGFINGAKWVIEQIKQQVDGE